MRPKNLTWEKALKRLKTRNLKFQKDKLKNGLRDAKRRKALVKGQKPFAIILSCADSRVVPEITFDSGLGELFVIRVAGNVANTSSIASIEYAVAHLGVNLIIVLGHESCGAVGAAVGGGDNGHNLNHLLAHITPAIAASKDPSVNAVVKVNANLTSVALADRSAIIKDARDNDGLKIVPAYYNLESGKVDFC